MSTNLVGSQIRQTLKKLAFENEEVGEALLKAGVKGTYDVWDDPIARYILKRHPELTYVEVGYQRLHFEIQTEDGQSEAGWTYMPEPVIRFIYEFARHEHPRLFDRRGTDLYGVRQDQLSPRRQEHHGVAAT